MIINHVELTLDSDDDIGALQAMFKFWKYQYEQNLTTLRASRGELIGAHKANEAAQKEHEESDEMTFFGPAKPYTDESIKRIEKRILINEKNFGQSKLMYDYFMKYIYRSVHSEDQN